MPSLLTLPLECIIRIFHDVSPVDVCHIACCCTFMRRMADDDSYWEQVAVAKWGEKARSLQLATAQQQQADRSASPSDLTCVADLQHGDVTALNTASHEHATAAAQTGASNHFWKQFCCKRLSARTPLQSPLELVQEPYTDPWQHITCCVLCSRTSGSKTISMAVQAFFEALPTPSAVLAATDQQLQQLLHPCGLQATRMTAVKSVAFGFLATDWQAPDEFHGCGKFVTDSWRIFCQGCKDSKVVSDANLKAYVAWRNREAQRQADAGASTAAAEAGKDVQDQTTCKCRQRRASAPTQQQKRKQQSVGHPARRVSPRLQQQQQKQGNGVDVGLKPAAAKKARGSAQGPVGLVLSRTTRAVC